MTRLLAIDAGTYRPSRLHDQERVWVETNCYIDLWIELLHALALDCVPALACTLSVDFEGDQWQFFKFPLEDLRMLYGLDVAEMNPWRGIEHHIEEQLVMGRLLTIEVDSWYLPDTAGVSYGLEHVKTSIVPNMIDRGHLRLGYFHGASYYELDGDNFAGLFDRAGTRSDALPPYVELVKLDGMRQRDDSALLSDAVALVRVHLARRPTSNPVPRFRKRLEQDVDWLGSEGLETFHKYAFATLRQFGSSAELASSLCEWLSERGEPTADAQLRFGEIATLAKTAQFQLARLVTGRTIDLGPVLDQMERGWDRAIQLLVDQYA